MTQPISSAIAFRSRCAFTALELMVAVAIIAILSGLLLVGVFQLQNRSKRLGTVHLMRQITDGLLAYEAAGGFSHSGDVAELAAHPIQWLIQTPMISQSLYLEIPVKHAGDSSGHRVNVWADGGTILDYWGRPLLFENFQEAGTARKHLASGQIRSQGGSVPRADDDVVYFYDGSDTGDAVWTLVE